MRKKILIICVAAVTLPALVVVGRVGLITCLDYFRYSHGPALAFDSVRWQEGDLKFRHAVAGAVAGRVVRPGLYKAEVEKVLGQPDALGDNGSWNYLTQRPGYHPGQPKDAGVHIEFDSLGRVSSVVDERWVE